MPLSEIKVGRGPYVIDQKFEKKLVPSAELLLTTLQAEDQGFVKVELTMPPVSVACERGCGRERREGRSRGVCCRHGEGDVWDCRVIWVEEQEIAGGREGG